MEELFATMPVDSGIAFVAVQHTSSDFKSRMDEILQHRTAMPVRIVADNTALEANTVYLLPSMTQMTIEDGKLRLIEIAMGLPVDAFFTSLAEAAGAQAVGVILSGTGKDGSQGIQEIHGKGGLVIAQSPESAQFGEMGLNAIDTGVVDFILSPKDIPGLLMEHISNPVTGRSRSRSISGFPGGELDGILALLQRSYKVDFAKYKTGTVERRVRRRMVLRRLTEVPDYTAILSADQDELEELYHDLLIGVTEFCRDEQTFQYFEAAITPELFSRLAPNQELRVWSAGCATGEEAYSLAILLAEKACELNFPGKIIVFATDVHRRSLETASQGIYTRKRLEKLSPERLLRYFTEIEKDLFKVNGELRKLLIFARHDLTSDIPFSRVDLVCCRNLLIYLRPEAQKKVLAQFHFALNRGGILFLGRSEGVAPFESEFEVLSARHKLFRMIGERKLTIEPDYVRSGDTAANSLPGISSVQKRLASLERQVLHDYDTLLEKHIPPGVLINEKRQIIHYFGDVAKYLKAPKGRVEYDILSMAEDSLHIALSSALQRVKKTGQSNVTRNIRINSGDAEYLVDMNVDPIPYEKSSTPHYHVYFERVRPAERASLPEVRETTDTSIFEFNAHYRQYVAELEAELRTTKEDFLATQENLQVTIEEFNATNEELQSANEELQSANEELQSANEELYSVNTEFERTNNELKQLNREQANLLNSMGSGIVFLDQQLCIRKFNPSISSIFNLTPQDIGRPLDYIAYQLAGPEVVLNDVRRILRNDAPIENEVTTQAGKWLFMQIVPFRSETGQLEGVIITFTDISNVKEAERVNRLNGELQKANANLETSRLKLETQNKELENTYHKLKAETAERVRAMEELRQKEQMLLQQSRMAAMGEMLNNISHQWRQPLNSVGLLIQQIGLSHQLDEFNQELLDTSIAKAMEMLLHMSQTIDDFRSFFSPDKEKSLFKVDESVRKTISLVEDNFRAQGITIEVSATEVPEQFGYPNEYSQALLNIMMNARDAFLDRGVTDGRVTVCSWEEDGRAVVTITDNAGGIKEEIIERIFDPYFTTKETGKGTGIGLFMSNIIVEKNMGGRLTARNTGDGAEFRIEV